MMTPTEQARAVVEALEAVEWEGRELTVSQRYDQQISAALSTARSLLLGLEREQGWRPIESAPKDGTAILVTRHMGHWGWVRGYARWEEANYRNFGVFAGWISHGFTDPPGELGLAHPTHWRPLPAPPESPEEDAKP